MIAALILAAGLGRRMGKSKPLIRIDGRPALSLILSRIDEVGITCKIVVLGREARRIEEEVGLAGCRIVVNDRPEEGLSSSLRLGLSAVPTDADGVLIFHADMPFIEKSTISAVISTAEGGAKIAAPAYRGRRGFPVYFARSSLSDLSASLAGDSGGRGYIADHPELLTLVDVDDPGCIEDIDRPEDLTEGEGETTCATSA